MRNENATLYCLGVTLEEHKTNASIRHEVKVMNVLELMRRRRLQWFGYICRREKEDGIRRVHGLKVAGKKPETPKAQMARYYQKRPPILFPQ